MADHFLPDTHEQKMLQKFDDVECTDGKRMRSFRRWWYLNNYVHNIDKTKPSWKAVEEYRNHGSDASRAPLHVDRVPSTNTQNNDVPPAFNVDPEPHGEPVPNEDDGDDVIEDIDQEVPVRCDKCDRVFIRVNQWQVKAVNGVVLCGECRGTDVRRMTKPKTTRSSSESDGSVDNNPVIRTVKPETLAQKKKAKAKAKPSDAPPYDETQTVSWQTKEDLEKAQWKKR